MLCLIILFLCEDLASVLRLLFWQDLYYAPLIKQGGGPWETSPGTVFAGMREAGADWPSGAPGEFPVAWQPIWPAALHLFFYYYYFILLLLLLFLLPAECTKVIISEFAIQ